MFTDSRSSSDLTPRQKRRRRRLESIREAALDLVIADGVGQFSVHRLAERLDLTVGALYRYYSSVDEILMAVQIDVLEAFDRYLEGVLRGLEATPLERIAILCRAYAELDRLQPERFRLIGRFVSNPDPVFDDEAASAGMVPTMRLLSRLAEEIEAAQLDDELSSGAPLDRAIVGWSSVQGIMERRKLGRLDADTFDDERLMRCLMSTLLIGWGASPKAAQSVLANTPDTDYFAAALEESATQDLEQ